MSDNAKEPTLECLECMQVKLDQLEHKIDDHTAVLGRIEVGLAQFISQRRKQYEPYT